MAPTWAPVQIVVNLSDALESAAAAYADPMTCTRCNPLEHRIDKRAGLRYGFIEAAADRPMDIFRKWHL